MIDLPPRPGAYAVEYALTSSQRLHVGRLGEISLPAGAYIYLGSANGPGGLRARLGRHIGPPPARAHWHIDHLHQIAAARAAVYLLAEAGKDMPANAQMPVECCWSQALAALPEAIIPAPAFGASDCRSGCRAHLLLLEGQCAVPSVLSTGALHQTLAASQYRPAAALKQVQLAT